MADLKTFRKINNLTQTEVGDYLGIKKAFISSIENGKAGLPPDKFSKLINNDRGWNVNPLLVDTVINGNQNNVNNGHDQKITTDSTLIEAVRDAQIAIREAHQMAAKSQEQIDRLLGIIEKLNNIQ